ncbi:PEP-CTERM sorting domain-containing protein [Coraliomargarita sp. SDUM461003]|uniref:PEP-CTERM sorting domain-containing protein n=1 Tax=Thalassobacterium maritimum TaxID=3041265 RepID=A0ABU1AUC8_9BACT|nr:PEP-CTERM sorting domain-containing protein [Coraliomargarita sp. SDUM461003]MDQ8207760.1 PEP-CTERM sorting domain-containing protein [Coraliomargarita sp. SDUM461003]
MKKIHSSLLLCASTMMSTVYGTISFDIQADQLQTLNAGEAMPTTGVVMLLADTDSNGFDAVEAFSFAEDLSTGITADGTSGDDLVLWYGDLSNSGMDGLLAAWLPSVSLGSYGSHTLSEGDALALAWFPEASMADGFIGVGASYGIFSQASGSLGSEWDVPADGSSSYGLYAFTQNSIMLPSGPESGALDSGLLVANLTTVPEPASAAALLGLAVLGGALVRRRVR